MSGTTVSESDEGKKVVNAHGDVIGIVSGVRGGTAYVDPDPGITDKIMSKLGWNSTDEEDYPLKQSNIDVITDDEVRLKRDL
jgi:hypothetical protein